MRGFFVLTLSLSLSLSLRAADWPQFRGPNGAGASTETNLPTGFTADTGLRWKVPLPARGLSCPVVVGGRVFITCSGGNKDSRLHVLAFDAGTGAKLWHRQFAATGNTNCHPKTCMAAPTPVADATGVYALFATGDLAAIDNDGNLRWYRSLVEDYPAITNQVGMAASPVLANGKVIVPMDNNGDSFLAAIDTKTGKNVWKVDRPRDINWTTPAVRGTGKNAEVLFQAGKEVTVYAAETGEKKSGIPGSGTIPSPTLADDLLLASGRGGLVAFRYKDGKPEEAWKSTKLAAGTASPVVYQGRVYAANSSGLVVCGDAKTGNTLWQERIDGPFSASPVAADGKLYVLNEKGKLTVLKLDSSEGTEVLGTGDMKEEGLATPAISGGAIFLRGEKSLFCVGPKLDK